MSSMDVSVFPSELLAHPQPLVGFYGLDIQGGNPVHKSIWDLFHNNRKQDRPSIQFKLIGNNYEFPVSKPKRQSYEWFHPKGILKRNWMLKHLHVLPAIVVLFQEMEWNDPQWSEKQLQCASNLQFLKNLLQGRNTRLMIVLLQKNPSPPGDDLLASERAANLTSVCDINAKLVFVLNYQEHIMGHILRLESAFLDISQSYYSLMAKQVKSHRDQITDHLTLKIRHQFKLGFISELRNDISAALKYYKQAYNNLDEIQIVNSNCVEIKTVAGYTNYKICRLMFRLNFPRDSITQFKMHIDKFRNRVGFKDLSFEHNAWMSVQYSAFAELFCEAIKGGLPAIQTQHPGIYFQKSAEYIGKRKESFLQCYALSEHPPTPTTTSPVNVLYSEFFGVRGTKTGEPISEQQMISMIQENEKNFNHSQAIITLLGQAMAQFKVYKCLRFRKKLAIDMAEEYLQNGDHSKALTLFSLMLTDYRSDKWSSIFTKVLQKTLRSAYLSAALQDFVLCSIEAMSPKIQIEKSERISILENMWKIFQNVPPINQNQFSPELKQAWEKSLSNFKQPIIVDLDKISDLLDCRVGFEKSQIKFEEVVKLTLVVQSLVEVPLKLKHFNLIINDSKTHYKLKGRKHRKLEAGSKYEQIDSDWIAFEKDQEFMVDPFGIYEISFEGESKQFMENEELQIVKLEIKMGTEKTYVIMTKSSSLNKNKIFKNYNRVTDFLDTIPVKNHCYITPTFHLTTSIDQSNQPMLVNEYFQIVTTFKNNFLMTLRKLGLSVRINQQQRNKIFLCTDLSHPIQKWNTQIQLNIPDLEANSSTQVTYYVISMVEGNIELAQKVWYETDLSPNLENDPKMKEPDSPILSLNTDTSPLAGPTPVKITDRLKKQISNHNIKIDFLEGSVLKKSKDDTIIIPCVDEMKFTARLYTLSRQALLRAYKKEDFLLRVNIEIVSPFDIEILDKFFICDNNIEERPYNEFKSSGKIEYLKRGDQLEDVRILNSQNSTSNWQSFEQHKSPSQDLVLSLGNQKQPVGQLTSKVQSIVPVQDIKKSNSLEDFAKIGGKQVEEDQNQANVMKTVYNRAMDSIWPMEKNRGFFKNLPSKVGDPSAGIYPMFGVYCVRWRRKGSSEENESKFIINGIEIVEPILNIYCYIEEKLYVSVPAVFKVTLANPTAKILHFHVILNNSDLFMFAGHKQLNISIMSHSTLELKYNLFPIKTGWQQLPELQLDFNRQLCAPEEEFQQADLNHLVKRWMPKRVFVHPPTKRLDRM